MAVPPDDRLNDPSTDGVAGAAPPILQPPTPLARRQLSLFQTFYAPPTVRDRLSNVIDIWDAAPKYATPCRRADVTDCPAVFLEWTFTYKGTTFRMSVAPALIRDGNGRNVYRFPTAREELIEDALRKIAVQQQLGFVGSLEDQPIFGVRFSLGLLRRELARHGHGIRYAALVESLLIMSGCVVEIAYAHRRTAMHRNTILSSLAAISREDYLRDPRTLWAAHFHPMVSSSLAAMAYRQYDYEVTMGYRSSLARWLHKHLAAVYLNAGMTQPYTITLSAIGENSGLLNHARVRDRSHEVQLAINELANSPFPVIRCFECQAVLEGRRIVDVGYTLNPTAEFVRQVVAANRRQRDGKAGDETAG
jgi:hypothetical protein